MRTKWIVLLTASLISSAGVSYAEEPEVKLSSSSMDMISFLEMVSEKLDIQIDASAIGEAASRISLPETGALPLSRARELVISALYLQGYTWIHDASDFYRIIRLRDARDQEIPMMTDPKQLPDSDLLVTLILPIKHNFPEFIARSMRSFMPANSRIIPDEGTQSVLITDSAHNIVKLNRLVTELDHPENEKTNKQWFEKFKKSTSEPCPPLVSEASSNQPPWIMIALFSLIALVIGFLGRGYVIRRIEGGL